MIKKVTQKSLQTLGFELVRYSKRQQRRRLENPERSFRDLTISDAMLLDAGEVTLEEARFLAKLVRETESEGPLIEIGTLFGKSTFVMLLEKPQQQKLISVDNYSWNPLGLKPDHHFEITREILKEAEQKFNLIQKRVDKNSFFETYNGEAPAMVFCDADHSYQETKKDIQWAMKVGAKVISGHDYQPKLFPGVVQAVEEFGGPAKLVDKLWVL